MLNAELLMFRQLSRHLVIVEGRNHHHSTRLDEAVLTSRVSSFYDLWMPRYSTKRVFFIINFDMSKLFRHFDQSGVQCRIVKNSFDNFDMPKLLNFGKQLYIQHRIISAAKLKI